MCVCTSTCIPIFLRPYSYTVYIRLYDLLDLRCALEFWETRSGLDQDVPVWARVLSSHRPSFYVTSGAGVGRRRQLLRFGAHIALHVAGQLMPALLEDALVARRAVGVEVGAAGRAHVA